MNLLCLSLLVMALGISCDREEQIPVEHEKEVISTTKTKDDIREQEVKAPEKGGNYVLDLPDGEKLELVWIEPGELLMGSPKEEPGHSNDETQHLVKLTTGYWLGKYEVTQGQWVAVMEDNPSNFQEAGKNAPVEKINWKMANEFCRKVTEREGDEGRLLEGFDV